MGVSTSSGLLVISKKSNNSIPRTKVPRSLLGLGYEGNVLDTVYKKRNNGHFWYSTNGYVLFSGHIM